jgi:hypothetical protein
MSNPMAEPDRLSDNTHSQHVLNAPRDLRIVLESKQTVAAEAVQDDIAAACRLTIRVTPLFGGFGEERIDDPRFLLLRIPGVSVGELPESPFALAHDLADRLHLVSVEPDLSTVFFHGRAKRGSAARIAGAGLWFLSASRAGRRGNRRCASGPLVPG